MRSSAFDTRREGNATESPHSTQAGTPGTVWETVEEKSSGAAGMDGILMAAVGIAGVLAGAILAWVFARARAAASTEAEVAKATAHAGAEIAAYEARAVATREELERERAAHADTRKEVEALRDDLEEVSDERATLAERASRVEGLETEVKRLNALLEQKSREISVLSASEARKQQAADSLTQSLRATAAERDDLSQRLQTASDFLTRLREQAGKLESELEAEKLAHSKVSASLQQTSASLAQTARDLADLRETYGNARAQLEAEQESGIVIRNALTGEREQLALVQRQLANTQTELAEAKTRLAAEQEQAREKLALLTAAREQLSNQFKALADEILDAKSRKFTEQNRENIGQLLTPLAAQISEFKKKVEDVYVQEGKDRTELASQVRQLMDLNRTLATEAHNLTNALKGQVKTQGNWGEMLLERLLQHAGLERNTHYEVQESRTRGDGSRIQPDFVLKLPNDRRMVIDAKVTLVAYERYANAETDSERETALKEHLTAVRAHIRGLSEKDYQKEYGLQSMDFVVMFMPVEPAFTLATSNDQKLFEDAYAKNILLVTNSTLLFVVRTVAYLWTTEKQNRNALDIASRGAELLEKLRLFSEEFVDLGSKLEAAHAHYDKALGRLSKGRGNLMRQAEMLTELGVKAAKPMPRTLLDARDTEDDSEPGDSRDTAKASTAG
ncbi:MAG: hypothetical protein RIS35_968 [Pseudomonadota bacterium]